ncbi:hypothetical protein [Pseudoalteromonas denitrificans]|uniref:hypothetical protein n=1 Tax=Pseudoalteromonas denitrificans TaxID=43656 RepID=UPI0015A63D61|nr:hypothetical protein [Pseudoalteromonas denitrificans]
MPLNCVDASNISARDLTQLLQKANVMNMSSPQKREHIVQQRSPENRKYNSGLGK